MDDIVEQLKNTKALGEQPVLDKARLKQFYQLIKNSPKLPVEPIVVHAVADLAQSDIKALLSPFKSDPGALSSLIKYLVRAFETSVAPGCTVYTHTMPHAPPQGMLQALLHPIVLWLTPTDQSPSEQLPVVEQPPAPACPRCSKAMEATDTQNHSYTYSSYGCDGCRQGGTGVRWVCEACRNDYCFKCRPHTPTPAAPTGALEMLVDPLLPMAELEAQVLRRCAVPLGIYLQHCTHLVGSWIELPYGDRPVALVVGCRQLEGGPRVHCLAHPAAAAVPLPWQLTSNQLRGEWLSLPEAATSRLEEHVLAAHKYHVLVNPPESASLDMAATTRLRRALWAAAYGGVSDVAEALTAAVSCMKQSSSSCKAADIGAAVLFQSLGGTVTDAEHSYQYCGPTDTELISQIELLLLEIKDCVPEPAAEAPVPAPAAAPVYRWSVAVVVPEGFPADVFLEQVMPMLPQVLGNELNMSAGQLGWDSWEAMSSAVQVLLDTALQA